MMPEHRSHTGGVLRNAKLNALNKLTNHRISATKSSVWELFGSFSFVAAHGRSFLERKGNGYGYPPCLGQDWVSLIPQEDLPAHPDYTYASRTRQEVDRQLPFEGYASFLVWHARRRPTRWRLSFEPLNSAGQTNARSYRSHTRAGRQMLPANVDPFTYDAQVEPVGKELKMIALLSIAILCGAGDGTIDREELKRFKQQVDPEFVMSWLSGQKYRDAIDVGPEQYKDLVECDRKYERQLRKIAEQVAKKYPPTVDPLTGIIVDPELHEQRYKEFAKKAAPVERAWRKDIQRILTPAQIEKMNELSWQRSGVELLFWSKFQRVLKFSKAQREAIEAIRQWKIETPENSTVGMAGDDHPLMIAKKIEAHKRALQLLTPEQREAFDFLLGIKKKEGGQQEQQAPAKKQKSG